MSVWSWRARWTNSLTDRRDNLWRSLFFQKIVSCGSLPPCPQWHLRYGYGHPPPLSSRMYQSKWVHLVYNLRLLAIFVSKIIRVGGNLTKLWQNNFAWCLRHGLYIIFIPIYLPKCLRVEMWLVTMLPPRSVWPQTDIKAACASSIITTHCFALRVCNNNNCRVDSSV